jgi:hypothetical protein
MDVEQRAREMSMAMTVGEVAKIISGAPFPSKQSLAKARSVVEFMGNRAALTPPAGFVLVPVEPSPAMIDAPLVMDSPTNDGTRRTWAYMLSARPEVK